MALTGEAVEEARVSASSHVIAVHTVQGLLALLVVVPVVRVAAIIVVIVVFQCCFSVLRV